MIGRLVVKLTLYKYISFGKLWTEIRRLSENKLYGQKDGDESWGGTTSEGLSRKGTREGDGEE